MAELKKNEEELKVLPKDATKCPYCGDQVYLHQPTGNKDGQGRQIITCTGCYQDYAME